MQQVENDILKYLQANPTAQDTVEGIAGWWLIHEHIERCVTDVRGALASLVAAGFVLERRDVGPTPVYGVNRQRLDEIRDLLRTSGRSRE